MERNSILLSLIYASAFLANGSQSPGVIRALKNNHLFILVDVA